MKNLLFTLALLSAAIPAAAQQNAATPEGHLPVAAPGASAATPQQADPASSALAQSGKYAATPGNTAESSGRVVTAPAPEQNLRDDKIYFFAHSMCVACKDTYVYLESNHRELEIPITDMKFHHNLELYKQCVKKFNIPNNELRLPLICMGDHYIMGWKPGDGALFEEYLKDFRKKAEQDGHAALSNAVDSHAGTPEDGLKEPIVSPVAPSAAPVTAPNNVEQALEKLKGSEPVEPTAISRAEENGAAQ